MLLFDEGTSSGQDSAFNSAARRLLYRFLPTAAGMAMIVGARCGASPSGDCPLDIRRVYLTGKAPQVIVQNKATYPVGQVVLHAAYQDLFNKYHEPTQAIDTVIQPNQRLTLSMPPVQGSVEWESLNMFATCERADSTTHGAGADSAR